MKRRGCGPLFSVPVLSECWHAGCNSYRYDNGNDNKEREIMADRKIESTTIEAVNFAEENGTRREMWINGATRGGFVLAGWFYWCARGCWRAEV